MKMLKPLAMSILLGTLLVAQTAYSDTDSIGKNATAPQSSAASPSQDAAPTDAAMRSRVSKIYGKLPLSFEANQGQTDKQVKFLSRGNGYSLFLTPTQAVLALSKPAQTVKQQPAKSKKEVEGTVLRMEWVGADRTPQVLGLNQQPGKSNYFQGKNPKDWQTDIPNYLKVQYSSVYPGIDLVYYGNQRQLEYDWVVAAGADPRLVKLKITGADRLSVNNQGDLVMHTKSGEVQQHKPRIYQQIDGQQKAVEGKYVLLDKQVVAFALGDYDQSKPLVIDPVLSYSTYLGGNVFDTGHGIAVDNQGNAYITGTTSSTDFPTTPGAFQTVLKGSQDTFVTKLNKKGTALDYSTYLGGVIDDAGRGIAVDNQGNAYITGYTSSPDFPTTAGAFQTMKKGGQAAFVTKLNKKGTALDYSTYLGGNIFDIGNGIAVDNQGNAYITGQTSSTDFPTTPGAFQTVLKGSQDTFVTKLNKKGTALDYSTYLGGNNSDIGNGIAVDNQGNAYIAGETGSSDFPTTSGAFQTVLKGSTDAFITKFSLGKNEDEGKNDDKKDHDEREEKDHGDE